MMRAMLIDMGDSREAVAARLKRVREALGLSKKDFAERAGLSEQVYGPYENARRELTLQSAKQIRKAYGISLEYMYFGNIEDLPTRISKLL